MSVKLKIVFSLIFFYLLFASSLYLFAVLGLFGSGDFILRVRVLERGVESPAIIFLQALYPEGFRTIYIAETLSGVVDFSIPVAGLKNIWDNVYSSAGCRATPSFILTVYTKGGFFKVYAFTLDWSEFKPYILGGFKEITLDAVDKMKSGKPRISSNRIISLSEREKDFSLQQYPPGPGSELADSHEEAGRVNLVRVETDSYSRAVASIYYESSRTLQVSVDVFSFEVMRWDIGGYIGLQGSTSRGAAIESANDVKYISMVATYRFEHWVQYIPDEREGYIEKHYYYVYWKNFQPDTLSSVKGLSAKVSYNIIETVTGRGYEPGSPTMYEEYSLSHSTYNVAVDAGWFIGVLEAAGKINPVAALVTLVVNVRIQYGGYTAMSIHFLAWGYSNVTFNVYRASTSFGSFPTRYWKLIKT
ncbi:MAG: hypothetical protein DRJ47_02140 [Thermoprotei archaeon]|nr:MAG: hypothetical protein DRJ47_02140 [Thermoprotei archaeon]